MTSVYPIDEKPNFPPSYEQATNYQAIQPIPSIYGMQPPSATIYQPQSVGMYAPPPMLSTTQMPPTGVYPSSAMLPPFGGVYPTTGMMSQTQAPPMATHMLITTQSLIYGDMPIQCICPHCQLTIVTRVEKQTGLAAWLACGGILILGGWLGCCLIPFCADGLKDTEHYCPNCAVLLGTRRRM